MNTNMENKTIYTCPMHPEVQKEQLGTCSKCGMVLVKTKIKAETEQSSEQHEGMSHMEHVGHKMKPIPEMSFWERLKISMTMTIGMNHTGLAGRKMARLMEVDIRNKFFVSLILTIPIILYSPLGKNILGINLPAPIPE